MHTDEWARGRNETMRDETCRHSLRRALIVVVRVFNQHRRRKVRISSANMIADYRQHSRVVAAFLVIVVARRRRLPSKKGDDDDGGGRGADFL